MKHINRHKTAACSVVATCSATSCSQRRGLRTARGVSDERCKWPDTLSCGLAGKGRYDRNTGGRESTTFEGAG
jgi:hypothetical protein